MKRNIIIGGILLIGLIFVTTTLASPGKGRPNHSKRPNQGQFIEHFGAEIGLTEAQQDELKSASFEREKNIVSLKADVKIAEIELRELMDEDNPNEAAVFQKIDEIGNLKSEIKKNVISGKLLLKTVLSVEQEDMLKEIRREKKMERREESQKRPPFPKG